MSLSRLNYIHYGLAVYDFIEDILCYDLDIIDIDWWYEEPLLNNDSINHSVYMYILKHNIHPIQEQDDE